jgi:hypothetical protein
MYSEDSTLQAGDEAETTGKFGNEMLPKNGCRAICA